MPVYFLLAARSAIILWVTLMTAPYEPFFDAIEDALDQQGALPGVLSL
jgi:hypothetical protein